MKAFTIIFAAVFVGNAVAMKNFYRFYSDKNDKCSKGTATTADKFNFDVDDCQNDSVSNNVWVWHSSRLRSQTGKNGPAYCFRMYSKKDCKNEVKTAKGWSERGKQGPNATWGRCITGLGKDNGVVSYKITSGDCKYS